MTSDKLKEEIQNTASNKYPLSYLIALWFWSRFTLANALVTLFAVLAGTFMGFAYSSYESAGPSVILLDPKEADGVATRGGNIDIVINAKRLRVCPSETSRFLWREIPYEDSTIIQYMPLISTTAPPLLKAERIMVSVPVPSTIEDGVWNYRSITVEHCSLFPRLMGVNIIASPDAPVRIIEPNNGARPNVVVAPPSIMVVPPPLDRAR